MFQPTLPSYTAAIATWTVGMSIYIDYHRELIGSLSRLQKLGQSVNDFSALCCDNRSRRRRSAK